MSQDQILLSELSEALLSLSVALQKLSHHATETLPIVEGVDVSKRIRPTVSETVARITSVPRQPYQRNANDGRTPKLE